MPKLTAPALPDGCPWSGWTPPNVDWCEEELCARIVNPADTWSNLAYIVFGAVMWSLARRSGDSRLVLFGPTSVAVGIGSFVYHASYTYFFQFFDFVGMFMFLFTLISANAIRLGWIEIEKQWLCFGVGVALFSGLVPLLSETSVPIQSLVAILIAGIVAQEIGVRRRASPSAPPTSRGLFYLALAIMAVAGSASLADVTRVWCEPANHWLQGHAVWHVLTATALYVLFLFYAQLPEGSGGKAR